MYTIVMFQEAHQTLDDLQASLKTVNDKIKSAAQYFCQDTSKFKLEELIKELLTFVKDFSNAKTVNYVGNNNGTIVMKLIFRQGYFLLLKLITRVYCCQHSNVVDLLHT